MNITNNNQNNTINNKEYKKFIIVTDIDNFEALINVEEIRSVYKAKIDNNGNTKTYIVYKDNNKLNIKNTVKEVYNKIYE